MAKLQVEQCLGCGSFVTFTLETTGLYVAQCWWCGQMLTQVYGVRPHGTPSGQASLTARPTAR